MTRWNAMRASEAVGRTPKGSKFVFEGDQLVANA